MTKTIAVKLDGTLIKSDGTTKKSDLFKFLDLHPDDYSHITYTPEEAARVRAHMMHLSTGATAAIPLICAGSKCPFAQKCPFMKIDRERRKVDPAAPLVTPVGLACLVEVQLLSQWTKLYIDEYDIDPNSFTEISLIRELAEIELMLWRLNNNLAKPEHAEMVVQQDVGIDKQGNKLTRMEISSLFEAKERLNTRKARVIKLMVGDRQEKYKREAALKIRSDEDSSSSYASLRKRLDVVVRQAKTIDLKLKQAEGKVIEGQIEITQDTTVPEENMMTTTQQTSTITPEDIISGYMDISDDGDL